MAKIKIKQFDSGNSTVGGLLYLNGTELNWSNLGNDAIVIPSGSTLQRPTGVNGFLRYNEDSNLFEGFENGNWKNLITSGFNAGTASNPGWAVLTDLTTGLFQNTTGNISFAAHGAEQVRFTSSATTPATLINFVTAPTGPALLSSIGGIIRVQAGPALTATSNGLNTSILGGPGGTTSGNGGGASVQGGTGTDGMGGAVTIRSGNGVSSTSTLRAGGTLSMSTGLGVFGGPSGDLSIATTTSTVASNGGSGAITMISGDADGSGNPGTIFIKAGTVGATSSTKGTVSIQGGNGLNAVTGGDVNIYGGSGGTTGTGAQVLIQGGSGGSTSGNAGPVILSGGYPTDGNGSSVTLQATTGVGTNRSGGNVNIILGNKTGTGLDGVFNITGVSAMQIPGGTTAQRPPNATEFMIRGNGETEAIEAFINSTWVNLGGGSSGPTNYLIGFKCSGSALDTTYTPTNMPPGWTITYPTNGSILITHGFGKLPTSFLFFGQVSNITTTSRTTRYAGASTNVITYDTGNLNQFQIGLMTNSSVGAVSGGFFEVQVTI